MHAPATTLLASVEPCSKPDGVWIATDGHEGNNIQFLQPDGTKGRLLDKPSCKPFSLDFAPDGRLAAGCQEGVVHVWDKDDKHLWQYPDAKEVNPQLRMIAKWNPAGDVLAVGSQDGKIRLLDRDGKLLCELVGHLKEVLRLSWTSDGRHLASISRDGSLRVWASDGQLEWIGFTLPDDTPVSIDAHGRILQGDPAKIAEHLAFTIRSDKGLDKVLTLDEFQEWRNSRTSGGVTVK